MVALLFAATANVSIAAIERYVHRARAYAALTSRGYETPFETLTVVVSGTRDKDYVRFRCVTPHCRYAAVEQPESATERRDLRTYDVPVVHHRASVNIILSTDGLGTFEIDAYIVRDRRRHPATARFLLEVY